MVFLRSVPLELISPPTLMPPLEDGKHPSVPPGDTLLPLIVQFAKVSAPVLAMPPPSLPVTTRTENDPQAESPPRAELPLKVQFVATSPLSFAIPPPLLKPPRPSRATPNPP